MHIRFLFLVFSFLLFSCNNDKTSEQIASKSPVQKVEETQNKRSPKIYDKFADLEPIFHKDNDSTYVINLWATWCKPCVKELPYFEELTSKFKNEKLKTVLISLDFPKQIENKLIPFLEKNNIQSEVVVLTDEKQEAWIDKIDKDWDGAIPVTLIYKKNKRKFIYGEVHDYKELEDIVLGIMN